MKAATHQLLLIAAFVALALRSSAHAEVWVGSSDVKFKGYSTLHNFEGSVNGVPLKVTVAGEKDRRVVSASSDVEVKRMNTRNDDRDRAMWLMFNASKFPLLRVTVARAEEQALRPGKRGPGQMPVALTIAGSTSTVNAAVSNLNEGSEALSFDLAFPVSLKAFKLDPPKALAGLVKVRDTVDVNAHVTLKKQP